MQRTLIFALVSLIAMMSAVSASPMPTAAPMIPRQDSGAQTTAPYTSTIDPSQGLNGNGCSQQGNDNVVTCCPAGYQNQNINGEQSCVKVGSSNGSDSGSGNEAPVGTGNGQDNGNDSNNSVPTNNGNDSGNGNDSNNQTIIGGLGGGGTTYTSDGAVIVSNSINQVNTFSSHQGASQSTSASSSNSKSGSNGGSVVHVPVSLVLAVVGAVAIGAF